MITADVKSVEEEEGFVVYVEYTLITITTSLTNHRSSRELQKPRAGPVRSDLS